MCTEYEIPPSSEFDVHILTRSIMTCITDFSVTKYVKYDAREALRYHDYSGNFVCFVQHYQHVV